MSHFKFMGEQEDPEFDVRIYEYKSGRGPHLPCEVCGDMVEQPSDFPRVVTACCSDECRAVLMPSTKVLPEVRTTCAHCGHYVTPMQFGCCAKCAALEMF